MADRLRWWEPVMGPREQELVCEVLASNFPNDGEYTTAFERRVAEICGAPHAVAVTSGTSALFLALAAAGVGPGDEVIVPDVTFIATANAVRLAGAEPVLVDVLEDLGIDPRCVEAAITPRTRAVIPVHVSGRAAALEPLIELTRHHGLILIEDAAEALGSRHLGHPLGSWGTAGCFSFSPNKTVTTGQGGVVVTSDEKLQLRLRELKDQGRPVRGTGGADEHVSVGFNFKLTNLQAAVGLAQLDSLPERLAHQRLLYEWYREDLAGLESVRLVPFDIEAGEVPQWIDARVDGRDGLCDFLAERGIDCRKFWYPLHTQAPYRRDPAGFPRSQELGFGSVWLPSSLRLERGDVAQVAAAIRDWDARRGRVEVASGA